ncbi:cellulase family glycosylhydrolase [Chitinophaga pinensis]|uniref:Glycoside hydrolase family 5 n=1 Tax=Chitinophaga pinensis (strain ATCC 43595 / DSM 2588 / LMG 13176 / NBRC 15968 / NCIMB 11800 / UQM 2034) TaxID=485918 RepID=A0A979G6T3_CHIPD|nr:cellulase family glycosylhydrolase [Chitinophaga pinensis]ACU61738.1 glycoside hydrolase family 5 [Chitinophaga pinensis DSM 2588]
MKPQNLLFVFLLFCFVAQAQVPWLHVDGNRIKDSSGNNITLRGVSIIAPEHNNECTTCNTKPISEMLEWQADAGRDWQSRVVRLQVTCAKVSDPVQSFTDIIDPYVQQAIAKGLYIIVDLHFVSNYGPGGVPQIFVMNFWKYVAPKYANVPNVLFEVYNEPINPDVWMTWKSYIQPVIDTIRAVAPQNIILVGGPQWSTRVNSAAANPIVGANLVYVYHIYPNQGAATTTNLNSKFGTAAQTIPVMVTEFGWNDNSNYSDGVTHGTTSAWGSPFRTYLDAHPEIGWTGYIFDNFWKPQYFDWSWNLMNGENQGQFMQQWLVDKKGDGQARPAQLNAYSVSPTAVNISWPADSTGILKRATISGGPYTVIDSLTAANYSDTGLTANTTYYYAINDGPEISVTTDNIGYAPDLPMYLTSDAGNQVIQLNWWKSAVGATSYNVYRSTALTGPYELIAAGVTGITYTDASVTNDITYYYRISSVNTVESSLGHVVADMPSANMLIVDNIAAVATGSWTGSTSAPGYYSTNYMTDGNTGVTGGKSIRFTPDLPVAGAYDVYMRWASGTNRASNTPVDVHYDGGSNSYLINQQIDNGVWKYLGTYNFAAGTTGNVLIRNDSANGYVIADAVKFVLHPDEISAPILKKARINSLTIYPNPATNTIQFSGVDINGRLVTIYDLSGVRKMIIIAKQQTLDVSTLQPGMYFVTISGAKTLAGSFIKN